jgi:hypothetical protein
MEVLAFYVSACLVARFVDAWFKLAYGDSNQNVSS